MKNAVDVSTFRLFLETRQKVRSCQHAWLLVRLVLLFCCTFCHYYIW